MAWFIGQSILMIALAFLLGLLVGWLIWGRLLRRDRPARQAVEEPPASVETAREPVSEPDPVALIPAQRSESIAESSPVAEPSPVGVAVADDTVADDAAAEREPVTAAAVVEPDPVPVVVAEPSPAAAVEPDPVPVVVAEPSPAAVAAVEPEPEVVAAEPEPVPVPVLTKVAVVEPDEVEPDDLERVEGIGPAMSRALVAAGIRTYEQLAGTDEDTLRDAIKAKGLKFAPSLVTWSRQARLLADGDEEGFADLTRRLVAGRDEGRQ